MKIGFSAEKCHLLITSKCSIWEMHLCCTQSYKWTGAAFFSFLTVSLAAGKSFVFLDIVWMRESFRLIRWNFERSTMCKHFYLECSCAHTMDHLKFNKFNWVTAIWECIPLCFRCGFRKCFSFIICIDVRWHDSINEMAKLQINKKKLYDFDFGGVQRCCKTRICNVCALRASPYMCKKNSVIFLLFSISYTIFFNSSRTTFFFVRSLCLSLSPCRLLCAALCMRVNSSVP